MMRNAILCLLLSAVLLGACSKEEAAAPEPVRPVLSMELKPAPASTTAFAGTIQPQVSAALSFLVLGRLVSRDIDVGDPVQKGEVLATVDSGTLQLQVDGARADLASAQAQLTNATASEERQRTLLDSRSTTQAAYDAAKQGLDSAAANVEAADAALRKAEEQLSYARLSSDFDGVVTATGADIGQVVNPGQMVVTVAQSGTRLAVIDIPDDQASKLTPDQEFRIILQSAPDITAVGKVREIAPQADSATRTRRVKLALPDDASINFRLGSTITAEQVGKGEARLLIPASAIVRKDGQPAVWMVDRDSQTVSLKPVELAEVSPTTAELKGGASAGELIVTAGVDSLTAGQKVKIGGEF